VLRRHGHDDEAAQVLEQGALKADVGELQLDKRPSVRHMLAWLVRRGSVAQQALLRQRVVQEEASTAVLGGGAKSTVWLGYGRATQLTTSIIVRAHLVVLIVATLPY
jgi:hypothetical protein